MTDRYNATYGKTKKQRQKKAESKLENEEDIEELQKIEQDILNYCHDNKVSKCFPSFCIDDCDIVQLVNEDISNISFDNKLDKIYKKWFEIVQTNRDKRFQREVSTKFDKILNKLTDDEVRNKNVQRIKKPMSQIMEINWDNLSTRKRRDAEDMNWDNISNRDRSNVENIYWNNFSSRKTIDNIENMDWNDMDNFPTRKRYPVSNKTQNPKNK